MASKDPLRTVIPAKAGMTVKRDYFTAFPKPAPARGADPDSERAT